MNFILKLAISILCVLIMFPLVAFTLAKYGNWYVAVFIVLALFAITNKFYHYEFKGVKALTVVTECLLFGLALPTALATPSAYVTMVTVVCISLFVGLLAFVIGSKYYVYRFKNAENAVGVAKYVLKGLLAFSILLAMSLLLYFRYGGDKKPIGVDRRLNVGMVA